jgi:hypothetical protein
MSAPAREMHFCPDTSKEKGERGALKGALLPPFNQHKKPHELFSPPPPWRFIGVREETHTSLFSALFPNERAAF